MTVASQLDGCLRYLKKISDFYFLTNLWGKILALKFSKIWSFFLLKKWNLNEIINISANMDSTKKRADYIWEMPGLKVFCGYCFKNVKLGWRLNVTNKFKDQRRLSRRLAIVLFHGIPCMYLNLWSELGTLEWITFNPNYLIRISTVETFNFSP